MNYEEYRQEVIKEKGAFIETLVDDFFHKAIDFAKESNFKEAVQIGNDALILSKYCDLGDALLYLVGMLCNAYLDNDQPEMANQLFQQGMVLIENNDSNYNEDINIFLDLKVTIDEELRKVNQLRLSN